MRHVRQVPLAGFPPCVNIIVHAWSECRRAWSPIYPGRDSGRRGHGCGRGWRWGGGRGWLRGSDRGWLRGSDRGWRRGSDRGWRRGSDGGWRRGSRRGWRRNSWPTCNSAIIPQVIVRPIILVILIPESIDRLGGWAGGGVAHTLLAHVPFVKWTIQVTSRHMRLTSARLALGATFAALFWLFAIAVILTFPFFGGFLLFLLLPLLRLLLFLLLPFLLPLSH